MVHDYSFEDWQKKKKTKLDKIAEMSIETQYDLKYPGKVSNPEILLATTICSMLFIISKNTRYEEYVKPLIDEYYKLIKVIDSGESNC